MPSSNASIPRIFEGASDYRDVPEALELAQATFNEEGLYQAIVGFAVEWHKRARRPARVLDLCSATGLSALRVAREIPVESVSLVDIEPAMLQRGAPYFRSVCPVSVHCVDAVDFKSAASYDLILMNSAYHHIEDARKPAFLRNALSHLGPDGSVIVGENFLPPYENREQFRASVVRFYEYLLAELAQRGAPPDAINVIRRSALYCWQGVYEYKVSWKIFLTHLTSAHLRVASQIHVWSCPTFSEESALVGTVAVELASNAPL